MTETVPQYDALGAVIDPIHFVPNRPDASDLYLRDGPHENGHFVAVPPDPQAARRLSREQMQKIQKIQVEGVDFLLKHAMNSIVTVRDMSFADKTMLAGLPPHLQQAWTSALNQNNDSPKKKVFADYLRAAESDDRIANICCVAGFVSPRLTLTKDEADRANDPGVWWVEEIDARDRKRYLGNCIGNENEEDLKRIAGFLDTRLADAATG